jgi:hypothetical protein
MSIRLGNTYTLKYLESNKCVSILDDGYYIQNNPNQPIFKGTLIIYPNGCAIIKVNYISYSGVKNIYNNYFDRDGKEIISNTNSNSEEKKYFNTINI